VHNRALSAGAVVLSHFSLLIRFGKTTLRPQS
jgi:hypothetical protein